MSLFQQLFLINLIDSSLQFSLFISLAPGCACTLPHLSHYQLDVSLVPSLDLRQLISNANMLTLMCSPATYSFPWGSHIASQNHTRHLHGHSLPVCDLCFLGGDHYSTGASFILGDFREENWDLSYFTLTERGTFWKLKLWKMKRTIWREELGGAGDEGISVWNGKIQLTHPKVHSPSEFPPLPTPETPRRSGEVTYEERALSVCV